MTDWRKPPPTPPHLRRYGWLRLYSDFPAHPKWRVIAIKTALPVHQVLAVATVLLCKANVGQPRGSLADFSPLECGAALDMPAENVARIYAAAEELGWIDQDFLVKWDERQPDREDPTNAERQRRYKAKRRAERDAAVVHSNGVTGVTLRELTTRQDKIRKTGAPMETVHINSGESGDSLSAKEAAEVWLATEGRAILTSRQVATAEKQAAEQLERWRKQLGDDPVALAAIVRAADQADYAGARCHNLIVDQVKRAVVTGRHPQLPLGPAMVSKRAAD